MSIIRKKGENQNTWNLEISGEVVGTAIATYKTATQRTWDATVTINGNVFTTINKFSVKQALIDLEGRIIDSASIQQTINMVPEVVNG